MDTPTVSDLAIFAHWCAAEGWSLDDFIQVLEKPWHFTSEIQIARALSDASPDFDSAGGA